MTTVGDVAVETETRRKFAIVSIHVRRGDTVMLYISLDYVPWWRLAARRTYFKAITEHIVSTREHSEGATSIKVLAECPRHPIPFFRKRREYVF